MQTHKIPTDQKAYQAIAPISETLQARRHTHGSFTDNAHTIQALKNVVRDGRAYHDLSPVQHEALDMILHKIGRAVNGSVNEVDHFRDIEGYAHLVVERMEDGYGNLPAS